MNFIETPPFSRGRKDYLTDAELLALKEHLALHPDAGDVILGAGGIRKLRWANSRRGKGKRSGSRTVYLFVPLDDTTHLLAIYDHEEKDDLSAGERRELAALAAHLKELARQRRTAREKK